MHTEGVRQCKQEPL